MYIYIGIEPALIHTYGASGMSGYWNEDRWCITDADLNYLRQEPHFAQLMPAL